ncbi:MAG: hypothetical protein GQ559_04065 [Desulfobulbaceae bacterium]|nr:hypothetical protein [Desulfobulbaceae bacterium]
MMLAAFSRYSAIILAVLAMSYGLPAGFDKVFGQKTGNPLLFLVRCRNSSFTGSPLAAIGSTI